MAGLLRFRSKMNLLLQPNVARSVSTFNNNNKHTIPCNLPHLLVPKCLINQPEQINDLFLKKPSLDVETIDFILKKYQTPPVPHSPYWPDFLIPYIPIITSMSPVLTLLAVNHTLVLGLMIHKHPEHFLAMLYELLDKLISLYTSLTRYLAGMSDAKFKIMCGILNFACSPLRSLATFKDFFINGIETIRLEGLEIVAKKKLETVNGFVTELVVKSTVMHLYVKPCPDEGGVWLLASFEYVLVFDQVDRQLGCAIQLPNMNYNAGGILSRKEDNMLVIDIPKCSSRDPQQHKCLKIPL